MGNMNNLALGKIAFSSIVLDGFTDSKECKKYVEIGEHHFCLCKIVVKVLDQEQETKLKFHFDHGIQGSPA